MKGNKVYLLGSLDSNELEILKNDIFEYAVHNAEQIKNLNFSKSEIQVIVGKALEHILLVYNPKSGINLGELVKSQVFADLRAEFQKRYPTKVNKVRWPDLTEKRPAKKLVDMILKLQTLDNSIIDKLILEVNKNISERQQKLLGIVLKMTHSITFTKLAKQFNVSPPIITREIRIIHLQLSNTLKLLGIKI